MIELEKLKDELHQDRYAAVAVIYDRQEKKVLITGTGDDDILVKMMRKAIIENCKIRDAIKANANLVGGSLSDTDIFNRFYNLFGNPFRR